MEFTVYDRSVHVLSVNGAKPGDPRILILGDADSLPTLAPLVTGRCCLAALSPLDWDADLTPWPAESARGRVWAGNLPRLIPAVQELFSRLPAGPSYTAGYSLGGLAALYVGCALELDGAASCSGSLWYPGAVDYFQAAPAPKRVYLSLGSREKKARDPMMAQVERCTLAIRDRLSAHFVSEPGGHFTEPDARLARGINWLLT